MDMHDIHESRKGVMHRMDPMSSFKIKDRSGSLLGTLELDMEQLAFADALAVDVEDYRQRTQS